LDDAGRGREDHVGRHRCENDEIHLRGGNSPAVEGVLGRPYREFARWCSRLDNVPLFDPGAGSDPFVGGVDDALQIRVRDDSFGYEPTEGGYGGTPRLLQTSSYELRRQNTYLTGAGKPRSSRTAF
jgi:hypothetical protein